MEGFLPLHGFQLIRRRMPDLFGRATSQRIHVLQTVEPFYQHMNFIGVQQINPPLLPLLLIYQVTVLQHVLSMMSLETLHMLTLNITTDTTPPTFSVTWPLHSYQAFVRAGMGNFSVLASDSSSIDEILYCISSTTCTPQTTTSGVITPLPSAGNHTLYLSIINGVGLINSTSIDFIIDNSLPQQSVTSKKIPQF